MKQRFYVSGIDRDNNPVWDTAEAESRNDAMQFAYDELDLDCVSVHRDSAYAAARCELLDEELNGKVRKTRKAKKNEEVA